MAMNVAIFDRNKLHQIPPILQDYALQMQAMNNSEEVRENYAQKFEVIDEYCKYVLDIHQQLKRHIREQNKKNRGKRR
jgi:hypothetical protein